MVDRHRRSKLRARRSSLRAASVGTLPLNPSRRILADDYTVAVARHDHPKEPACLAIWLGRTCPLGYTIAPLHFSLVGDWGSASCSMSVLVASGKAVVNVHSFVPLGFGLGSLSNLLSNLQHSLPSVHLQEAHLQVTAFW